MALYAFELIVFLAFFYTLSYAFNNDRDEPVMSYIVIAVGGLGAICSGTGLTVGILNRAVIGSVFSALLLLILLGMLVMLLAPLFR